MTRACPRCGGTDLRQITPGFVECRSEVVAGAMPPGLHGHTVHVPVHEPCGHRFQTAASWDAEPCALCGRDSIGRCQRCSRRICGLDGTTSGPFLCRACVSEEGLRREREAADAQAKVEADVEGVNAALAESVDAEETVRLIRLHGPTITSEAAKVAWVRAAASGCVQPTHDLATVVGRTSSFGRSRWNEEGRARIWAANADAFHENGRGWWLDDAGTLWRELHTGAELLPPKQHVVFVIGRRFTTMAAPKRPGHGWVPPHAVVGGVLASSSGPGVAGEPPYAEAVAFALEARGLPHDSD